MGTNSSNLLSYCSSCLQKQQMERVSKNTTALTKSTMQIIQNDYKRFQQQNWFRFQKNLLFDPKIFIFLYHNYDEQQTSLINHWRNIDMKNAEFGRIRDPDQVMSQRWKYAIRKGVPIIYYNSIISVIFNRNFSILNTKKNYQKLVRQNLLDLSNKSQKVPIFGIAQASLEQAVFAPFLNAQGYKVLANLLRLISKVKGRLTYNKYLVHLIPLFLIFFQQEQTFDIISIMIDDSTSMDNKKLQSLRWHIIFKQQQIDALGQSFYSIIKQKSACVNRLFLHFQVYKIDRLKLFKNIMQDFFYGFFPFKIILRIFIIFLNQGFKFIYRIFYAILKGTQEELKEAQTIDKCILAVRKRWIVCTDQDYQNMLKVAYNLCLQKYITSRIQSSLRNSQNKQKIVYYIPYIKNESQILTFDDLQTIWEFLPNQLKHYDVQKVFGLSKFINISNQKAYQTFSEIFYTIQYSLLVIKSINQTVFGVFFAKGPKKEQQQQYGGHSQNFLFRIFPDKRKYISTGQNVFYLIKKSKSLQIGGGNQGPALKIDQNLLIGQSFKSLTYNNDPLHMGNSGNFQIKELQLFKLY